MEYSVTKQLDIQAIIVNASGLINTEVAEKMVLQAGITTTISGYKRCLFDLTNTTLDPGQLRSEMFMFADILKNAGFTNSIKIASLLTEVDEHRKSLEISATSKGLNLKHFTDRNEALSWLCS